MFQKKSDSELLFLQHRLAKPDSNGSMVYVFVPMDILDQNVTEIQLFVSTPYVQDMMFV